MFVDKRDDKKAGVNKSRERKEEEEEEDDR